MIKYEGCNCKHGSHKKGIQILFGRVFYCREQMGSDIACIIIEVILLFFAIGLFIF